VHCGLGQTSTIDTVSVRWPSGKKEAYGPFPAGKLHVLVEGRGK
jgi:hypothetical protein